MNIQSFVWRKYPPSILNPFQRYPIYLTLHKILDGTNYLNRKNNNKKTVLQRVKILFLLILK
ncbi:hypothetical protein CN643_04570 [Parageobacillus yumthangensis]|nr:hypothetical protein CN643_04570 [Parageobacillus yumthangensis]PUF88448.1 hypothetical protein DCC82_04845 [Geobacillus sp. LYN3]